MTKNERQRTALLQSLRRACASSLLQASPSLPFRGGVPTMRRSDPLPALCMPRLRGADLHIFRAMKCHPRGEASPLVSNQRNFLDFDPSAGAPQLHAHEHQGPLAQCPGPRTSAGGSAGRKNFAKQAVLLRSGGQSASVPAEPPPLPRCPAKRESSSGPSASPVSLPR